MAGDVDQIRCLQPHGDQVVHAVGERQIGPSAEGVVHDTGTAKDIGVELQATGVEPEPVDLTIDEDDLAASTGATA